MLSRLIEHFQGKTIGRNIVAAKSSVECITELCKDALETERIFHDAEAGRQFVKSVNYMALNAKRTLDTMLH